MRATNAAVFYCVSPDSDKVSFDEGQNINDDYFFFVKIAIIASINPITHDYY
jgi:hypothetical protein